MNDGRRMSGSQPMVTGLTPAQDPGRTRSSPWHQEVPVLSLHHPPLVYVLVRPLPELCQPAQVIRHAGRSLIWAHPESLRVELVFWLRENLTTAERLALREAWGMSAELAEPPDDDLLDGTVGSMDIPQSVVLPAVLVQPLGKQRAAEGAA